MSFCSCFLTSVILYFQIIILNQCDFRTAEVNVATNCLNNFFSLSCYNRQNIQHKGAFTLLNKFSGQPGFKYKNYFYSGRSVRSQPEENIANNHNIIINVDTLSYFATETTGDTRKAFKHNELKHMNASKGESSYLLKVIKKNIKQVLHKVKLGHSWSRYMEQRPYYVVSRPFRTALLEPTTISTVPTTQQTMPTTKYITIKSTTEGIVMTRKNVLPKQSRKKIGNTSTIPLSVRFGTKIYVVTRELTKKEKKNVLSNLVKLCTKYNPINCLSKHFTTKTKLKVTSLTPSENNYSRWSTFTATANNSTTIISTESPPIDAINKYVPPSETYTKKIFTEISANETEKEIQIINNTQNFSTLDSTTISHMVEVPILSTINQVKQPILTTALDRWPMFTFRLKLDHTQI